MTRQPPENQNLYAELSERVGAFEMSRSFSSLTGSFTTKVVKDATYWYFKTSEGPSGQREYYVGPDDAATRKTIALYREGRAEAEATLEQIWRLCAMLRLGGSLVTDTANAKVLSALGNAGVFKLGAVLIGPIARLTRTAVLEVLGADFVRTARAKGLRETVVIVHHALRNAMIPVVTLIGLQAAFLLGGAVVTETMFSWPGVGRLAVGAIVSSDFPTAQGAIMILAIAFLSINLLVDVLYVYLDPRVQRS